MTPDAFLNIQHLVNVYYCVSYKAVHVRKHILGTLEGFTYVSWETIKHVLSIYEVARHLFINLGAHVSNKNSSFRIQNYGIIEF